MSDFRTVSVTELKPVLDVLEQYDWPIPFERSDNIFQQLGWQKLRKKGGNTDFRISKPFVSIGELHGELSRIEFRVSDTFPEANAETKRILVDALEVVKEAVTDAVGFASTGTPWTMPGYVWDFADGRQIQLKSIDRLLELQYWSKRYADIERSERRQGVDPSNNLETE